MGVNQSWRDKPITKKQIESLRNLVCELFGHLTRGEASYLIQRWSEANERCCYDQDVLEESK